MPRVSSLCRLSLTAGAVLALAGCLDHPIKKVTYDKTQVDDETVNVEINKDVDILFVIDNSGSMAEEQALVSKNFASFLTVLEADDVGANYRLGITTTDVGNPRCPNATYTPENGRLVLSSCVDRAMAGEFTFNMNKFDYACTDYCSLTDAQLQIKPTATQYSNGEKAPRKWIERIEGDTNLPDGVTTTQAFQCFGPQGVAGCGFESHLEAMYKALAQASREDAPTNYGFLRDSAILSILFLSDETDCTVSKLGGEIFTTNKVYWNDPADPAPTSAVCWRAGAKCDGAGPTYERCYSSNHDLTGAADVTDDKAVLEPLAKYVDFVQGIETEKKKRQADQEVLVALIAGVPPGYEDGSAELVYQDAADADFQKDFGIGPGCELADPNGGAPSRAVPPVREREFAEAFQVGDTRNLFSICQNDYSAALKAIADKIRDQIKPACMPKCVKDTDPSTPVLDPSCQLVQINSFTNTREDIVLCNEVNGEWQAPAGVTACFAELIDSENLTPSPLDDISPECADEGYNLEFKLIRTAAAPAGTSIQATCELSPNKAKDCPML